uniref:Uncharacterized protein n=1 Tax=Meloidogyne enterolobii TaxID=390850 RepID=A0A6V7V5T1_MELEN|nr:unnamed protein product [Meloidogyne enterolobii]
MNGAYAKYSEELVDRFRNISALKVSDIDQFVEEYKKLAKEDKRKEGGYPKKAVIHAFACFVSP